MSVNASFTFSDTLMRCSNITAVVHMIIASSVVKSVLLLPLSTFVLYLGQRQWQRQQCSFKSTSHCDFFTYHLAVMELIWNVLNLCSYPDLASAQVTEMTSAAAFGLSLVFYGQIFFHLLTTVDRYLAVVYPIIYMRLKSSRGVQIRNISVVCVWLLCFVLSGLSFLPIPDFTIMMALCLLGFSIIAISFCSMSVLCVLSRPRPGERAEGRQQCDEAKLRAFYTIMAIMAVLCSWILGFLVLFALRSSTLLSPSTSCFLVPCAFWFNLPSSLLLPVLYLHRAGKLSCCSNQ